MCPPSLNPKKQWDYRLAFSLKSIIAILFTACASSFLLGRNRSLLLFYLQPNANIEKPSPQEWNSNRCLNFSTVKLHDRTTPTLSWYTVTTNRETPPLTIVRNEMMIHPVLLTHPDPKQVAIVSSNPDALIDQVRKHVRVGAIWVVDSNACSSTAEDNLPSSEGSLDLSQMDWIHIENLLESKSFTRPVDVAFIDNLGRDGSHLKTFEFWYRRLSLDGILVMPLGKSPFQRFIETTELENAGFARITDYEVVDHGTREPYKFAVAFKSSKTKAFWHLTEAHYKLMIQESIRQEEDGGYPFEYFDSVAMMPIQYPSRISEAEYCRYHSNPPSSEGDPPSADACTKGHGLDPEIRDVSVRLLKVQKSAVGEHAGRGIFSTVDIPPNSYLALDSSSHPVRCPWITYNIISSFHEAKNKMFDVFQLNYYFDGYGFMDEKHGEPQYVVDSGILTFVNHGCNGTFTVGLNSEVNEFNFNLDESIPTEYATSSADVYNPAEDRAVHIDDWVSMNFKEIKAGNELLDNYLPFGGEEYFKMNALALRQECSGILGLVEQYQKNATMHTECHKNASFSSECH